MAKIKSGAAWALATVEEFPGIRNDPDSPSRGAREIVNFRIREDGSLEKRSGWRLHRRFPATIRALWKGSLDNTSVVFAVAASSVYRWDESSQDLTLVRTIGTSSGNATFIPYMDTLLLIDGNAIYRYSKSQESFIKAFGYVPLVGKDWHPVSGGEWAEARNLLTNYYRITYQNPGGYADYYLPYPASLIRVWVNGVEVFTHSFTSGDRRFSLSTSIVGEVSVLALATDDSMAARIHTASRGILFEDGKHDALLLGGGGCGYHVFASSPVSEASYAEACAKLEESDRLYFPTESLLFLGDAEHPVTAFCKYHGRVIAFNSETAWSIGYGSDTSYLPNVLPIHNAVGCDENGTVTAVDDAILLSNRNGIWSVRASVAYPEEWTVREHSGPIRRFRSALLGGKQCAVWVPEHREYWIRNVSEAEGRVWIYSVDREEWYSFDNIHALQFLRYDGKLAFFSYSDLCVLEEDLRADDEAVAIEAYYQSGYFSLSRPAEAKRVLRAVLTAGKSTGLTLTLQTDRTSTAVAFLPDGVGTAPQHYEVRFHPGRFHHLSFRIASDDYESTRCYGIAFYANP